MKQDSPERDLLKNAQGTSQENSNEQPNTFLYHIFGIDRSSLRNIIRLSGDEILYLVGKSIVRFNISTRTRTYCYHSMCERLSCMTIDMKQQLLFVGEVGNDPSIMACSLPDFKTQFELKDGSRRGYSCLNISRDQKYLCSVSMKPDYIVTVWDLMEKQVLIKHTVNSNECFNVSFSPFDDSIITTSGSEHIMFWELVETFTGLKLQHENGRFGRVDSNDILSTAHLQNEKLISGSRCGHLLLWDEGFLKCRFVEPKQKDTHACNSDEKHGGSPSHEGGITFIHFDVERKEILSAGEDASIKWWCLNDLYQCIRNIDENMDCQLSPTRVLRLKQNIPIAHVLLPNEAKDTFLIVGANGKLWQSDIMGCDLNEIWHFHCVPISDFTISPYEHLAVTCDSEGYIFCWDFLRKTCISTLKFKSECTCIEWFPDTTCPVMARRSFLVGFSDGMIRSFYATNNSIILRELLKPHASAVEHLTFHNSGEYLASCGRDGDIFIFRHSGKIDSKTNFAPIGFVKCNGIDKTMRWKQDVLAFDFEDESNRKHFEVDLTVAVKNDTRRSRITRATYNLKIVPIPKENIHGSNKVELSNNSLFEQASERKLSFDMKFLLTVDYDNCLVVLRLDETGSCSSCRERTELYPNSGEGSTLQPKGFGDIQIPKLSSISEGLSRKLVQEDVKFSIEEEQQERNARKNDSQVREKIDALKKEFLSVIKMNESLPPGIRMPQDMLIVDHHADEVYDDIRKKVFAAVTKEYESESNSWKQTRKRLEEAFVDNIDYSLFDVKGLINNLKVDSCPTMKLPHSFHALEEKFNTITKGNIEPSHENISSNSKYDELDVSCDQRDQTEIGDHPRTFQARAVSTEDNETFTHSNHTHFYPTHISLACSGREKTGNKD